MKKHLHKILDTNPVLIETEDGRIIPTTPILTFVSGGKRVQYIDKKGNIIRTLPLSRTPYNTEANKKATPDDIK